MRTKNRAFSAGHPSHHVDWAVDYDYVDQLSEKDRAWLARFTDEFYLSKAKPTLQNQEQTRERWRAYKAGQRDLVSRGTTLGKAASFPPEAASSGREREQELVDALDVRANRARHSVGTLSD